MEKSYSFMFIDWNWRDFFNGAAHLQSPMEVIDYVVIHELVHLEVQNHSSAFWKKVEEFLPDYKKRRAWLKTYGFQLNLGD